jgi:hypothetical protein
MSPQVMLTALLCVTAVGLAVASAALLLARRRLRTSGEAAERRIDALAERVARLEARLPEPPHAPEVKPSTPPAPVRKPKRRADRPADPTSMGPTLIAVPDLAGGSERTDASAAVEELGRRFGAIWEMADAGAPAEAIARATGLPIGRVELILGLRRQAGTPGHAGPHRP